jgi:dehydrogenase/reductase SDR family member 7B
MASTKDCFRGRVVWITGASSGIGEQLAHFLARAGARLILSARNEDALQEVRARCAEPGLVRILPLDLEQLDRLTVAAQEAAKLFGHIDVLINNAGVAVQDLALNTSLEVDRRVMAINYFAPVTLIKALLPAMLERGEGQVVAVSSLSGKFGLPRAAAYAASKHALHGFMDSLRVELRGAGVAVTTVVPGIIRTDITVHALTGDGKASGRMLALHLNGVSAERCAEGIVRALRRGKPEPFVGGPERVLLPFRRLFPRMFYRFIGAHPVKRLRRRGS